MKKIAIITITRGTNYGNRLQNYAVQELLKKFGYDAETLSNTTMHGMKTSATLKTQFSKFNPSYLKKVFRARTANALFMKNDGEGLLRSLVWRFFNGKRITEVIQLRKRSFTRFDEINIQHRKVLIDSDNVDMEMINDYEFFVCGSDQVWNPYYPQTSMIDFLCFAPEAKRIAYAPSFGVNHLPDDKKDSYKQWISAIPHLSVREEQGASIIKELSGRDATVLVDPTLMLNSEEWLALSKRPDNLHVGEKFVLAYFLGNKKKEYQRAIDNIAEQSGCRIINLGEIREFDSYAVDPGEFIYLINNATIVCTDSFHGAVFSMIMHTDFIVFNRVEDGHSMGSRLETLLKKFGMEDRLFGNMKSFNDAYQTDFSSVDSIITIERDKAYEYLAKAFAK